MLKCHQNVFEHPELLCFDHDDSPSFLMPCLLLSLSRIKGKFWIWSRQGWAGCPCCTKSAGCSKVAARVCCLTKTGCTSRLASHLCCWRWSLIGLFHYMPTDCLVSSISLSPYCQVQPVILPYRWLNRQFQPNISIYKQYHEARQCGTGPVLITASAMPNMLDLYYSSSYLFYYLSKPTIFKLQKISPKHSNFVAALGLQYPWQWLSQELSTIALTKYWTLTKHSSKINISLLPISSNTVGLTYLPKNRLWLKCWLFLFDSFSDNWNLTVCTLSVLLSIEYPK